MQLILQVQTQLRTSMIYSVCFHVFMSVTLDGLTVLIPVHHDISSNLVPMVAHGIKPPPPPPGFLCSDHLYVVPEHHDLHHLQVPLPITSGCCARTPDVMAVCVWVGGGGVQLHGMTMAIILLLAIVRNNNISRFWLLFSILVLLRPFHILSWSLEPWPDYTGTSTFKFDITK